MFDSLDNAARRLPLIGSPSPDDATNAASEEFGHECSCECGNPEKRHDRRSLLKAGVALSAGLVGALRTGDALLLQAAKHQNLNT